MILRKRKGTTSIYKGVTYCVNRKIWQAQIKVDGKCKYIGRFSNEISAALAYDLVARIYQGAFGEYNFPQDNEK